jgi:hypothetical protein
MFDIRRVDLGKLNSMTKYPSILTYHLLGDKGMLQERVQVPFEGRVLGTEKVDGTNTRLIFCPDGAALVGSREDLLWERRDLIGNPAMGIVEAVRELVRGHFAERCATNAVAVYFLEVFGRGIGAAAKNYTKEGRVGFRLFDVAFVENYDEMLTWPPEKIAHWRDTGGQRYVDADRLAGIAQEIGVEPVPALFDTDVSALPTEMEATYQFLLRHESTRCKLDDGAAGVPEGVVVRSPDRSRIAKIRREDYERTLMRRKKG